MKWFRTSSNSRRLQAQAVAVPPSNHHKFDEQTGQVYTETTAALTSDTDRDWLHQAPSRVNWDDFEVPRVRDDASGRLAIIRDVILKKKKRDRIFKANKEAFIAAFRKRKVKGPRSLADLALETILRNVRDLDIEMLDEVPIRLLELIWDHIKHRQLLSFHTWRVFSHMLRQDDSSLGILRYRDQIHTPKSPLSFYTNPLTSQSFDFLVYLSITTSFAVPDLVKLSALKNLVALEIVSEEDQSTCSMSNRIIRAWSIAARSEASFQVLRILKLWNHPDVTNASLTYLDSFPSLSLYDVTGCGFNLQASIEMRGSGWKPVIDADLLGVLEAACVERAAVMRSALDKEPRAIRKARAKQLSEEAIVSRMPRAEVPEFLSRDELTHRRLPEDKKKKKRISIFGKEPTPPSLQSETWDFPIYTKICKIGELRNDGDFKRAGIDIGEQLIAEKELISPRPIVSLRLGDTPLCLVYTLVDSVHSSFKSYTESRESAQERLLHHAKIVNEGGSREALQSQRLAFTRIKYDVTEVLGVHPVEEAVSHQGHLKRPSSAGSRLNSSGESTSAKRRSLNSATMQKKRKSLGDVLNSFVS